MSRTERASPIPKFLGVEGSADAFELLGLTPDTATAGQIEVCLQRQLDRVQAHVEGDTPEADEVRLALHAAAAQVLDPGARRAILEARQQQATAGPVPAPEAQVVHAATPAATPAASPAPSPSVGVRYVPPPDTNAPVRRLLLILGIGGGLAVVAIVFGLIFLAPKPGTPAAPATTPAGPIASTPTTPQTAGSTPAAPSSTTTDTEPKAQASKRETAEPTARSAYTDGALVVRQLRAASAKAKTDPEGGLAAFRAALRPLADWWAKMEVGQRRAADDAVTEFLYVVAENPEIAGAAIEELSKRATLPGAQAGPMAADAVWPAAWATGVLARLGEERGLPRSIASRVAQALNDVLGAGRVDSAGSFESGAMASLRRMPARLVAPLPPPPAGSRNTPPRTAEAVRRWADAAMVVASDEMELERVLIDGLEQVIMDGPSPEEERAAFDAIETLVTRIKWRAGGPARERLLEWFNDPRVSAAALRIVTSVLAGKSGAENVDPSMLLSVTASPDDRSQLRARYAAAWGLTKTETRDKALGEWRSAALAIDNPSNVDPKDDELAKIARLVMAVRTNHAARRLWLGDAAGCSRIISDIARIPSTIRDIGTPQPPSAPGLPPPGPSPQPGPRTRTPSRVTIPPPAPGGPALAPYTLGDGLWAEAYLKAERNIPVRLQRLTEAEGLVPPLARADAQVLVDAAMFASPATVRQAAQRVVMRFGDDPSIVESCLDLLPRAPKVQSVSDTLAKVGRATLPKIGDPEWELAARRVLVERALGLMAGQGPQAGIDQGSALIAESYVAMAGVESGAVDEGAADRCVRGAGELFKLWRLEAERLPPPERPPLSLEQIDRRRRSRQQIASGPLQTFSGEETSVAEIFAYIVCAERPVQTNTAVGILDDLARDRRATRHVLDQMQATERAIARLWMLRFGEVAQ